MVHQYNNTPHGALPGLTPFQCHRTMVPINVEQRKYDYFPNLKNTNTSVGSNIWGADPISKIAENEDLRAPRAKGHKNDTGICQEVGTRTYQHGEQVLVDVGSRSKVKNTREALEAKIVTPIEGGEYWVHIRELGASSMQIIHRSNLWRYQHLQLSLVLIRRSQKLHYLHLKCAKLLCHKKSVMSPRKWRPDPTTTDGAQPAKLPLMRYNLTITISLLITLSILPMPLKTYRRTLTADQARIYGSWLVRASCWKILMKCH